MLLRWRSRVIDNRWKMWVELSSNFCHLSDIVRPPLRTNSLSFSRLTRLRTCEARALHARGSRLGRFAPSENVRKRLFCSLACQPVSPSVRQSIDQLDSQSVSQSVNRSVGRSTNQWISQSVNRQSINQSTNHSLNQSINQSISLSINQSINQSISQSINQSINQSVIQSISQSVNQSICRPVHRSIGGVNRSIKRSINSINKSIVYTFWCVGISVHFYVTSKNERSFSKAGPCHTLFLLHSSSSPWEVNRTAHRAPRSRVWSVANH